MDTKTYIVEKKIISVLKNNIKCGKLTMFFYSDCTNCHKAIYTPNFLNTVFDIKKLSNLNKDLEQINFEKI